MFCVCNFRNVGGILLIRKAAKKPPKNKNRNTPNGAQLPGLSLLGSELKTQVFEFKPQNEFPQLMFLVQFEFILSL